MSQNTHICLGAVAGVHGVRGAVKIKCFTEDPLDISSYGPLSNEDGSRTFTLKNVRPSKGDLVIAKIEGIDDRDIALALKGTRLYVARDTLPDLEEETWYHADLIGLRAELSDGSHFGDVTAFHNFGAGDLIEIKTGDGKKILWSFTKDIVPSIEIKAGRIIVEPPEEIAVQDQDEQI
jgi:16S rRNA processing protein RimM